MPIFRFKGYSPNGTETTGTIEASGIRDAVARVKSEGILPSTVTEATVEPRRGFSRRHDETFLPNVTRQLSILVSTGVPLVDALTSLSGEYRGFYRTMITAIKERVSGGASLQKALEDFSGVFPKFYISMIEAGEASGTLDKVLARLADFLESQSNVRAKVRAAMIYPLLMMSMSFIVLSFLFTFVIPKIVKIFRDAKAVLPFITKILIFMSTVFVDYWWVIAGVTIAGLFYSRVALKKHRVFIDTMLLKLPGNVVQSLYYARFARTLGFLLEGGVAMLKALRLSSKSMGNSALEGGIVKAEEKVAEGQRLSASLEGFPPVFIQLIATGEKSGKLSETLSRAADSYEEEFTRRINKAVSLFEPAMILLMGLIVAFIVLAVLLPMFQLNQLIR